VGGFGLLLLLILLLGWVTLSLFSSLRSVQRRVFDDAIPGLVTADEIVRSYAAQSAAVRGYLITPRPELLGQYEREVEEVRAREREGRRLFRSQQERELLDELVRTGDEFERLVDERVVPLAQRGNKALAFNALGGRGAQLIAEIESLATRLRAQQDQIVVRTEDDLRSRSNQVIATLLIVTIGALTVGIVLAILLPARLVANISRLVEATRAIGRGDLDQRVQIHSGDEVEELSARFGEMQAGLKRLQQLALQDRELEIASSIQRNLLQRVVPEVPGVQVVPVLRQANRVGGDWYDVDFAGDDLTIAIGDASGKGIAAALMATVALSVLRAERGLGAGPRRVVGRANEALKEATDPDSFTTLVYASIDWRSGEMKWLNMGHPAPFLVRAHVTEGLKGEYLERSRNKTLGWFDDPGLNESAIRLEPGDRLIFYTDGFLETKSPAGDVYGEDRFAEAMLRLAPLRARVFSEELVKDVEHFAAGKLDDDLTMIIVEFQGAPPQQAGDRRLTGEEPWHSRR
jgi:serine phosphatase RsbU (regulator of sigma subunit)/CHASE3 domain sensor protein